MKDPASVLTRGHCYPLGDRMNLEECRRFDLKTAGGVTNQTSMRAVWTGEKRPPRAGEWYLSGAEIRAYKAPNDLGDSFHIARLVKTRTETRIVIMEE